MLTCDRISVKFNDNLLFSQLGFSLYPGSALIIRGNNGSGKTTLLKVIAGLIRPKAGYIYWNGQNIHDNPLWYNEQINYVGHLKAIKSELTVLENLTFWAKLKGHEELIMAAIYYFRLHEMIDIPCSKLSAGWQKRVALARLIICPASLWLLDEPEANLDATAVQILSNLINTKIEQQGTVIIASHNLYFPSQPELQINDFLSLTSSESAQILNDDDQ
jgi:heme exporter protein A